MKLQCIIDGRDREFHLEDGAASVVEVEPGVYSVVINGRSYEARVNGAHVDIAGRRYQVEILDPREPRRQAAGHGAAGRRDVTAPMPGKVVRVLAAEGDSVEYGQGLVVVEAMKMQNEVKAPKTGRILALPVREGDTVASGDVLATLE